MARIRSIKPGFFKHGELFDAEQESGLPVRLAYAGLWCCADREGRFKWKPRELKTDILPHDDVDFAAVLDALARHGFVIKYEVAGQWYGMIPTFHDHQTINQREAQSVIPPAPVDNGNAHARTCNPVHAHGEGKGREGKGKEDAGMHAHAPDGTSHEPKPEPEKSTIDVQRAIDVGLRCFEVLGWDSRDPTKTFVPVHQWLADGASPDLIVDTVRQVLAKKRGAPPGSLAYFTKAIGEALAAKTQAAAPVMAHWEREREQWQWRLKGLREKGFWTGTYGPKPGEPLCRVPPDLAAEFLASWESAAVAGRA